MKQGLPSAGQGEEAAEPLPSYEQAASRALEAFLVATSSRAEQPRAIRAITFHMLEGHAPRFFERWKLGPRLEEAVRAMEDLPLEFPSGLDPDDGIARVDAVYLRHERNLPYVLPERGAFTHYLQHLDETGSSLYAWLLSELMKACGLTVPLVFPERPFKPLSRLLDLYWVTHLYLLDTRYFHAPLRSPKASEWTKDLLGAAPWVLEERRLDLAGEVAFCLQAAGAAGSDEHRRLLDALLRAQQPDGRVVDLTLGDGQASQDEMNHTTAAALIAFAGAEEHRPDTAR